MSTGELCRSALRFIEDSERDRNKNFDKLKMCADNGIFSIQGRTPNQLEEMELLDTLSTYFTLQREDLTKSDVFHQLFTYFIDPRRLDFLSKLTSLAICISSAPVLDLVAVWIKCLPSSPRATLSLFSRRILADLLSIDPSASDVLASLPKVSMTFAEAFLLGLTDTYNFLDDSSPAPHPLVLRRLLGWLRLHRDAFLGQTWASSHARKVVTSGDPSSCLASEEGAGRSALVGLFTWTITQPLCRRGGTAVVEGEGPPFTEDPAHMSIDRVVAGIHFELLEHMENKPASSSSAALIPLGQLEELVQCLALATIPSTPVSPTTTTPPRTSAVDSSNCATGLDTSLERLAELVQIGLRNGLIKATPAQLETLLMSFKGHKFIGIILNHNNQSSKELKSIL